MKRPVKDGNRRGQGKEVAPALRPLMDRETFDEFRAEYVRSLSVGIFRFRGWWYSTATARKMVESIPRHLQDQLP